MPETLRITLDTEKTRAALIEATSGNGAGDSLDPIAESGDADDLYGLVTEAQSLGLITRPKGWEIYIYPVGARDDLVDVAKVELRSEREGLGCQVIDSGKSIAEVGDFQVWGGDDDIARSLDVLQGVVDIANSLVGYLLASEEVAKTKLGEAHASADNKEDSQN